MCTLHPFCVVGPRSIAFKCTHVPAFTLQEAKIFEMEDIDSILTQRSRKVTEAPREKTESWLSKRKSTSSNNATGGNSNGTSGTSAGGTSSSSNGAGVGGSYDDNNSTATSEEQVRKVGHKVSKSSFTASSSAATKDLDVDDPDFWLKVLPQAHASTPLELLDRLSEVKFGDGSGARAFLKDLESVFKEVCKVL